MAIRVGINGFGRIGRMILRAVTRDFTGIEIVAINGLREMDYLAYMLKYDSVHGRFPGDVAVDGDKLIVDGKPIQRLAERDPANLRWGDVGADIVIECTGHFLTQESCQAHIDSGAKKVVQSAPGKDDTPIYVYGVNHDRYQGEAIVSAASCTTNGLAPVAKVLNDAFGIKRGLMTAVHATTGSQRTVDGSTHRDWRGGRGILDNIIPTTTGAAKAVGKVIPELSQKLTGMSFRVPVPDISVVDLTCELETATSYEAVVAAMKAASERGPMRGVLGFTDEKVVSTDFRGTTYAAVFDAGAGIQLDPTFLKVVAWYDNEYGYTCNLVRLVEHISK